MLPFFVFLHNPQMMLFLHNASYVLSLFLFDFIKERGFGGEDPQVVPLAYAKGTLVKVT